MVLYVFTCLFSALISAGHSFVTCPKEGKSPEQIMAKTTLLLFATGLCVCVMIYGILMTGVAFDPDKSTYNEHLQLPVLQTTTHQQLIAGQPFQTRNAILVGAFRNSSTNHTKMNPHEVKRDSELRREMMCKLKKNVPFSTITRKQAFKDNNSAFLPEESLEKLAHFNSCAVVSSSHAMRLHTYGQEINSHDAVLRFNCAPTHTFEKFVGNRTDFRMINTLIPIRRCREEFWSKNSTMFTHGILVIRNMDGIKSGPRDEDLKKDTYLAFANVMTFRKTYPNRSLPFIHRPKFGQDIATEFARFCNSTRLCEKTKFSPSTGLFGVVMMLHLCDWVHVYELVPSKKNNANLVYYYDETAVRSSQDRHSYYEEQIYVKTLSLTPDKDIDDTGVVLLQGLSQIHCG
ncbi:ST6GAL1 [Branchiostoma lanceolatum]|uniref:beta-galactoside alpha-(2,6)-sialyltransferase n=1 Tax=Branchiostoma lanceolatum TaxID=7740 RepID=A0A8J9YP57_BRALA|nr:ST6GAL1 [Branchiostoma lanceolatum]